MLTAMYFKQDACPLDAMKEMQFCAAQGRDHRQCCIRNGVTTTLAGAKCLVFCDQRPECPAKRVGCVVSARPAGNPRTANPVNGGARTNLSSAVKFARSASAARGSPVRIPGADMAPLGKPCCGRHPTYKVEEDGHGC
uniref:Domain of unknown function DB domain-containing protein n=1 Tax=Parascaris univalens TaxID=6257 RepID=A0A915CJI4_PARUN